MKKRPYCAEEIQNEAIKCRHCGEFLDARGDHLKSRTPMYAWGYEYRSQMEFFGLPLVHITQGFDPITGFPRTARGVIAIGNVAVGMIAIGGFAFGGFAIGGLGFGLLAFGGISIGVIALGGLSLGAYFAAGGLAISMAYAIGGLALAPQAIGSTGIDPDFL